MDVTDISLNLLLQLYNNAVGKVGWQYAIRLNGKRPFKEYPWYQDLINLYNILHYNKITPREYLTVQISHYKKATRFSRNVPSIRMMTTPAALEVWAQSQTRVSAKPPSYDQLIVASTKYMQDLIHMNGLASEEEFFKDPFLIREVSRAFLNQNSTFKRLLSEGYYKEHFGLETSDIL